MTQSNTENSREKILQRIRDEILPIFDQAITDDQIIFQNKNIIHCREKKNCDKTGCPVFDDIETRCWQIAGTFCGEKIQGTFADKYETCRDCEVFRAACPTLVEELGEYLNNLLFLKRKQTLKLTENTKKIEYLNKELISSLEILDSRNREIQELVITDKLTSLYNRHYLMTMLEDEIIRCSRKDYVFSLLMVDVDNFKNFNDTYGHLQGDKLLSLLGTMIKQTIRKYDRAFRYGGEEFVVVLPETNLTIAWMIAERLRENFEKEKFIVNETEVYDTISASRTLSIGCASYYPGMKIEDLIGQADEAMYTAKSRGKNQVIRFDEL